MGCAVLCCAVLATRICTRSRCRLPSALPSSAPPTHPPTCTKGQVPPGLEGLGVRHRLRGDAHVLRLAVLLCVGLWRAHCLLCTQPCWPWECGSCRTGIGARLAMHGGCRGPQGQRGKGVQGCLLQRQGGGGRALLWCEGELQGLEVAGVDNARPRTEGGSQLVRRCTWGSLQFVQWQTRGSCSSVGGISEGLVARAGVQPIVYFAHHWCCLVA